MEIHLTRAVAFAPVCRYLESQGATVARDLEAVMISPELLASPEALVPLEHCARFVDSASSRYGVAQLGLEAGSGASIADFGLFGDVLKRALTLQDVIEQFIKWVPLADSGARAWTEVAETGKSIRFWIDHEVGVAKALVNEYGLMLLIDAVRLTLGPDWRPSRVWMPRAKDQVGRSYEALSEAQMIWNSKAAGIEIPVRLLAVANVEKGTFSDHGEDAEEALRNTGLSSDPVALVSQVIRSGIGCRLLSLDEVAEIAGKSGRAVQRRLQASGTTYRALLDRVRFEEAILMLGEGKVSVSEMSRRLGYGDPANFTHAFARWTGHSPSKYRDEFLAKGLSAQ